MTSPTSANRRRGFTLIELLVVIGVIAILVGLVLFAVRKAFVTSKSVTTAGQMQTITLGLKAFYDEHGFYPQLPTDAAGVPVPGTGAATLGRWLVAPGGTTNVGVDGAYGAGLEYRIGSHVTSGGTAYVATRNNPAGGPPSGDWAEFNAVDFVPGPGFKTRNGPGKVYGPYLAQNFPQRGLALLDSNDNAILYFPGTGRKTGPGIAYINNGTSTVANYNNCVYNASNNPVLPMTKDGDGVPKGGMRMLMGDTDEDGIISGNEKAATNEPFILWSAGPDGIYGYDDNGKCDDVANFDLIK
jgi:prepilin-type N-terminal cleavage/methylation domain-containing protein